MNTDQKSPENVDLVPLARERHQAALLRYATKLLGDDALRAREVVEGSFEDLKAQPTDEIGDELAEWLFAACRHRVFAILQREGRMNRFDADNGARKDAAGPATDEAGESEDSHVTMQRLIDRLTPKQQEAMRLKFQHGFGCKEIAGITDLSASNISTLVHNAVGRLGREFREIHQSAEGEKNHPSGSDDPRLTLYALGEMEEAERKRFEKSLFDRKTAGVRIDQIRTTCELIGKTLAIEAGAPAPRSIRRKKASRRTGLALWFGFPRVLAIVVAIAVLVGLAIFLTQRKPAASTAGANAAELDFRLKAAPWEEQPALAKDAGASVSGPATAGGSAGVAAGRSPPHAARTHLSPGRTAEVGSNERNTDEDSAGDPGDADANRVDTGVSATARGRSGDVNKSAEATGGGETVVAPVEREKIAQAEAVTDDIPVGAKPDEVSELPHEEKPASRKPAAVPPAPKADAEGRKFSSTQETPISQLPADVDTTSIVELKRALAAGRLPPVGGVRTEAMLNYFPYYYPAPAAPADFAPAMESAEAPWAPDHRLVRVGFKVREAPPPVRAAANLILLIDTSGSMAAANRLPLVKEAVRLVVGRLRPDDRVGIVTYAGESRLTLMPTRVADALQIFHALDRLKAGGMTNGGAGLELAYDLAKVHAVRGGVNCVILCTDGDFNVGATSEEELTHLIDQQAGADVQLSIFGFGRNGNIDPRLEALAAHGRGSSGYVNTRREAEQILTAQLNGLFEPVARDVKVEVAFNPVAVQHYRLIGYEDRTGELRDVGPAPLESATVLPGQTLTALYEVVTAGSAPAGVDLLKLKISYRSAQKGEARHVEFPLADRPSTFAEASSDFRFAAAVAAFGMALTGTTGAQPVTLEQVAEWGQKCLGDDAGGYRSEFLSLVEQARAARR